MTADTQVLVQFGIQFRLMVVDQLEAMNGVRPAAVRIWPVIDLSQDFDLVGDAPFHLVDVVDATSIKIVVAGRPDQYGPLVRLRCRR